MEARTGFVGIIIQDRIKQAENVNRILSSFGDKILGRMGLPCRGKNFSVITLIVDATTDELGSLTGKLGSLDGVSVKSALIRNG